MKGLVIKNTGSWYTVLTDEGQTVECKIKGNFRLKGIRSTNPVAVGDRVKIKVDELTSKQVDELTSEQVDKQDDPDNSSTRQLVNSSTCSLVNSSTRQLVNLSTPFITEIEDRRNYIIRKSQNLSKQSHILAANIDQAFLVVTVNYPETSTTFIDRFLASAEAYSVPVVLVFNKTDRLSADERQVQEMMIRLYEAIGYRCVALSARTGEGVDGLWPLLKGKITLLSGNSGVGKSTLINRLIPGLNLRTAEISDAHNTGLHTTTFSEMISLPSPSEPGQSFSSPSGGGWEGASWLIDTPGIKGFGTFDMEPEEITSYFKEIFQFSKDCRFSNCTHTHEPGCAVLRALDDHLIAPSRYQSYLSMLNDKDESKYREAY